MSKIYDVVDIVGESQFTYQLYSNIKPNISGSTQVDVIVDAINPNPPDNGFSLSFTLSAVPNINSGCYLNLTGYQVSFTNPGVTQFGYRQGDFSRLLFNGYSAGSYLITHTSDGIVTVSGGASGTGPVSYVGIPSFVSVTGEQPDLISNVVITPL